MRSLWDRVEELFERARNLPTAERSAFLAAEAGRDPTLQAEVAELLEAAEGAAEYLEALRRELLEPEVDRILREVPDPGTASDPWVGRTLSHYRIVERIGGGGMGVVYRGYDPRLDRPVALKLIAPEISRDPEAKRRFLNEARAASAPDHLNICTIHEIGETDDGRLFIAMPAYEGKTLRARLDRGPLEEPEAIRIGEQIAQGLAAAHRLGIVHGDVKPANVFLTSDGVVKLLDFGLARRVSGAMRSKGPPVGSLGYMSPERMRGSTADPRSDVWAVGVVLREMITGERPIETADRRKPTGSLAIRERLIERVEADLSRPVARVVNAALSMDPERRHQHGDELVEALRRCGSRERGSAWREVGRRTGWRLGAGAGIAGMALIGAFWFLEPEIEAGVPWIQAPGPTVSHILWVDDNPENNDELVRRLRGLDVRVTTALNTTEGLERYDPAVSQLVVSDMGRYEGKDDAYVPRAGFHLFDRLKERDPDVRLAFCTSARGVAAHQDEALATGALGITSRCDDIFPLIGL